MPVLTDGESSLDLDASDTVQDLKASIGHLSRMLILAQFSTEQRVRSEGMFSVIPWSERGTLVIWSTVFSVVL